MKRVAVVRGKIQRDKFYFPCRVNQRRLANVVLDTGAFDFILSERVANQIRLSRHKAVTVRGVSGTTRAWTSRCDLSVGGQIFRKVPCVIIKDLPYEALFGLRFFVDHGYRLLLDPNAETLSILR